MRRDRALGPRPGGGGQPGARAPSRHGARRTAGAPHSRTRSAAEFYFSPDGRSIIGNAKQPGDDGYHVYTIDLDGTGLRRINDRGADACAFFSADGERLIWTSTREHLDLPPGDFSDPDD